MPNKIAILFTLACWVGVAEAQTVKSLQTSATQAVMVYTAPSSTGCTIQVSESSTLTPPVHDVDTSLFAGANADNRTGNTAAGLTRTFVIGTRRVDVASDGKRYSRALQANTQHYYLLTCGSSTASGQFITANPPLGNSYPEPMPFNSAGWGNYGWPTINWNDQTVQYIDPLTGILIKRVTSPGQYYGQVRGYNYDGAGIFSFFSGGANWTNPANIGGASQSIYATYSAATSDPIFVAWGSSGLQDLLGSGFAGLNPVNNSGMAPSLDNIQLALFGTGTDATATNRQVDVCLSFFDSGTTCNTAWQTITLPTTAPTPATTASIVSPSSTYFPDSGFWTGWTFTSGDVPKRGDISVYAGNYSVTGSTVTNTGYHGEFSLNWKAGGKLYMSGTSPTCAANVCTIASVTNGNTLVITQSFSTTTTGSFYSLTSGVVVKKHTGTGQINLSLSSAYTFSSGAVSPNGGDNQLCSDVATTISYAADGITPITPVAGELCQPFTSGSITSNPGNPLFALIPSTGESRYLWSGYVDNQATAASSLDYTTTGALISWLPGPFDTVDPNALYLSVQFASRNQTIGSYVNQAPHAIVTAKYNSTSAGCHYQTYGHSLYPPAAFKPGQDTTYTSAARMWPDSCMSFDSSSYSLTNGTFLEARVLANAPNWKPSMQSNSASGMGIASLRWGKVFVQSGPGGQNTAAGLWMLDAPTGNLLFSGSTLIGPYPTRWAESHTTSIGTPINTFGLNVQNPNGNQSNGYPGNGYGRGPFVFEPTQMLKAGSWTSDTSIAADTSNLSACPTGLSANLVQQGAIGTNCITFQSQMACSAMPYWPPAAYTTVTANIPSGATTIIPVANTAGLPAAPFYAYITFWTFNSAFDGTSSHPNLATFQANFPGSELVYVTAVNSGASTLTVQRGINGVIPPNNTSVVGPNSPYPNGIPSGAQFTALTGLQSPEAADYPCDHGPTDIAGHAVWSEPSPIAPGDIYWAWEQMNQNGGWEGWQIVSATSLGSTNYQFVASRNPTTENYCWNQGNNVWPSGWWGMMMPLCDSFNFVSTTNPSAGWTYNFVGSGHTAFGWNGASPYPSTVESSDQSDPYIVTYQQPIMSPSNPFVVNTTYSISSSTPFAGYAPLNSWQSYPSQLQFASPDPINARWMVDWHAINPSNGTSADVCCVGIQQNFNNGTLVGGAGFTTVWKFTPSSAFPYKVMPVTVYAGYHLLQDTSSPTMGNTITDSTPWQFCAVYTAGECHTGSATGEVYMSVPQAGGVYTPQLGGCWTNFFDENMPCAMNLQYHGASMVQGAIDRADPTGKNWRKITTGFMGPGREISFTGATMEPTGQWAFFNCIWCDGVRSELFMAKLPPFPSGQPLYSQGFVPLTVSLEASTQYDQARIRFGYVENGGNPSNFYCTQRADGCMTSTVSTPFAFLSENAAWATCSSGCTITVPSIPGRVLYYVIDRQNSSSGVVDTSDVRTSVTP